MNSRGSAPWSTPSPRAAPDPGDHSALLRRTAVDIGIAALVLALAGAGLMRVFDLGLDYPVKALLAFGLAAALVARALSQGRHPHPVFGPANRVTLLRVALGALLAALIGEPSMQSPGAPGSAWLGWGVVGVATVAAVLDAADGALARRSGLCSGFGARFDMESDAAFTLVLSVLVWQGGQAGAWVLAAGLMRYAFVAAAWRWVWLAAPLPPSRRRQAVCVVQITSLVVCLGPVVPPAAATGLALASLALLVLSFAVDVRWLARARPRPPET